MRRCRVTAMAAGKSVTGAIAQDRRVQLVRVDNPVVTAFDRGRLRTENGPERWVQGAVHDAAGMLVPESQRLWHGDKHAPIAADPPRVRVPRGAPRLPGTWLYAGHWSDHFGHFLLETLPNLWPDPADHAHSLDGVLVHRPPRGRTTGAPRVPAQQAVLTSWQQELLDLAGYGATEVRVVQGRPARVDQLLVPGRPALLKRWALPPAVNVWRRVGTAVGSRGAHPKIYLSRTRFHAEAAGSGRARTDPAEDAWLDERFARAGFLVLHPQTLSIADQVSSIRGAHVVAGLSGSSLHLSVFADPGTQVISIGDHKSPRAPARAQVVIDDACGHRSTFVADRDRTGLDSLLADLA